MVDAFNTAPIPKAWVAQILAAEHDDGRFELFANAAVTALEGKPVVGTSASWDLGRDGRSIGSDSGLYVLTTLQDDEAKPKKDAARLKKTTRKIKQAYYVSAAPHSEHTLKAHGEAIGRIFGPGVRVEALDRNQIADLVSSGKIADAFRKSYAGEIAGIQTALASLGEADAHLQQLELALSTFGANNSQELRLALGTRLVLGLLERGARGVDDLNSDSARALGVQAFSTSTMQFYCKALEDKKLVERQGTQYHLTGAGREALDKTRLDAVAIELKGNAAVRATVEDSLGSKLADQQWSSIWVTLQVELARAFYQRGKQLLEMVSALLQGNTSGVERDVLGPLVDSVLAKVAERHVTPPQRPVVQKALQDAFLPGDKHGAFEWLAGVAGRFAAICVLGLPAEVAASVRTALRTIRFFFDTDVVISYMCPHEPPHAAADAGMQLSKRMGHPVMVTEAVVEEVARHAMKAHTDYRVRVAPLKRRLEWYEIAELESAFTREFEYLRVEGRLSPGQWTRWIQRYTGPETRGRDRRLVPNVALMRRLLSSESFVIQPTGPADARWQQQRDALAAEMVERAKRRGESDLELIRDKARIDAEMLMAVARTMEEAQNRGTGERYVLVTSARRLRELSGGAGGQLPYVPEVLSLPEVATLASLLPEESVSLRALHGLLFEGHFAKGLAGLEAMLLRVVREATSVVLPGATRGVLIEEFKDSIIRETRKTGEVRSEVRARISRDGVEFAKIAGAALDALALQRPAEREEVLKKIQQLAKSRKIQEQLEDG
jgi:hypothetical protein